VTSVEYESAGETALRATCHLPQGEWPYPALVLVNAPATLGERFAAEGYVALVPERALDAEDDDRRAALDLDAGAAWLAGHASVDPERIGAIGFGVGGVYAYLLGCHSRRIAAVVSYQGAIVYRELSSAKPVQPLEMALNLSAPLLAFFGEEDVSIPQEHVGRLRDVLSQFAKTFEVHTYPGAGADFFEDDEAASADAWSRTLAFLSDSLV